MVYVLAIWFDQETDFPYSMAGLNFSNLFEVFLEYGIVSTRPIKEFLLEC